MFTQLVMWVVTTLIASALQPKPKSKPPANLSDFSAPTAEDGREIPVLFGTREIEGPNCVWYGHLDTNRIRKKV